MILNSDSFWSNVATYKKTAKKSFMLGNLLHNIFTLDDFAYINGSIAERGIILVSPWVSHEDVLWCQPVSWVITDQLQKEIKIVSLNVRDNAFALSLLEKVLKSFLYTSSIHVAPHLLFILN